MEIKSGSNLLISTSTRMFFIFLGKPITTFPRGFLTNDSGSTEFHMKQHIFFLPKLTESVQGIQHLLLSKLIQTPSM